MEITKTISIDEYSHKGDMNIDIETRERGEKWCKTAPIKNVKMVLNERFGGGLIGSETDEEIREVLGELMYEDESYVVFALKDMGFETIKVNIWIDEDEDGIQNK